jgi:hypothetical protein
MFALKYEAQKNGLELPGACHSSRVLPQQPTACPLLVCEFRMIHDDKILGAL